MKKTRQSYSANFKAKIVLLAIEGDLTVAQISSKHSIQANQVTRWKQEALAALPGLFDKKSKNEDQLIEKKAEIDTLYKQVGKLTIQNEFLREKLFP